MWILELDGLDRLVRILRERGLRVVGPVARDGAVVYDEIESAAELPVGIGDDQAPGHYRLVDRGDAARFGYSVGPHSWKRYLFPAELELLSIQRSGDSLHFESAPTPSERYAFLGVRACELAAIEVQDRVFLRGGPVDPAYAALRDRALVVLVQCGQAASTCFCASTQTGPRAEAGFDLALTELLGPGPPSYLVETGSEQGVELLRELPHRPASPSEQQQARDCTERAARQQTRALPPGDLSRALAVAREHPRWDQVADRCLGCGSCTLVCPTCFCSRVEDTSDLSGERAERRRHWDSCFSREHSHLHGGDVRHGLRARYRQWLTHKLGSWWDQFGTSGCVGCGRCLSWCPVGIDLVEEAQALCATAPSAMDREGEG